MPRTSAVLDNRKSAVGHLPGWILQDDRFRVPAASSREIGTSEIPSVVVADIVVVVIVTKVVVFVVVHVTAFGPALSRDREAPAIFKLRVRKRSAAAIGLGPFVRGTGSKGPVHGPWHRSHEHVDLARVQHLS